MESVSSKTLNDAVKKTVKGFTPQQKSQYNYIVSKGYKPAVAAANVSRFPNTDFKSVGKMTAPSRLNRLSNARLMDQLKGL